MVYYKGIFLALLFLLIFIPVQADMGDADLRNFSVSKAGSSIELSFIDLAGCKSPFPGLISLRVSQNEISIDEGYTPDRRAAGACAEFGTEYRTLFNIGLSQPFPSLVAPGSYSVLVFNTKVGDLHFDEKGTPLFQELE